MTLVTPVTDSDLPNTAYCGPVRGKKGYLMSSNLPRQEVVVTDVHMPFGSMVTFMVKSAIASIPALIILVVGSFLLGVCDSSNERPLKAKAGGRCAGAFTGLFAGAFSACGGGFGRESQRLLPYSPEVATRG